MASSLTNLFNNFAEGIQHKSDTMMRNVKLAELNIKIATDFFITETLKMV